MICPRVIPAMVLGCAASLFSGATVGAGEESQAGVSSPYAAWQDGPPKDAGFFPIAVWLQSPANAAKYRAIGVNVYVGLWRGPNAEQIAELSKHNMPVFC
jgi:hypothetical protein